MMTRDEFGAKLAQATHWDGVDHKRLEGELLGHDAEQRAEIQFLQSEIEANNALFQQMSASLVELTTQVEWLRTEVMWQTGATRAELDDCMSRPDHMCVVNHRMGEARREAHRLRALCGEAAKAMPATKLGRAKRDLRCRLEDAACDGPLKDNGLKGE